jgi:hypothetical protein
LCHRMVERMAYKRRTVRRKYCLRSKYFTARAGAPQKHSFHFAPSPNSAQACQDDTQPFFRIKYVALTRTNAHFYSHAFNRSCQKLRYLGYISGAKPELSHTPVLRPLLKVEQAHHQARMPGQQLPQLHFLVIGIIDEQHTQRC